MRIVLVGAGGLGTNLGLALHEAGHDVLAVFSRTMEHARMLAERIGSQPTDDICALPNEADLFIVSVKDAVLTDVVQQLVQGREEQFFAHTAGSMPLELFQGMARHYGVFYPMQSFSKERRINFSEVPVFLEASNPYATRLRTFHRRTQVSAFGSGLCLQLCQPLLCSLSRDTTTARTAFQCHAASHRRDGPQGALPVTA